MPPSIWCRQEFLSSGQCLVSTDGISTRQFSGSADTARRLMVAVDLRPRRLAQGSCFMSQVFLFLIAASSVWSVRLGTDRLGLSSPQVNFLSASADPDHTSPFDSAYGQFVPDTRSQQSGPTPRRASTSDSGKRRSTRAPDNRGFIIHIVIQHPLDQLRFHPPKLLSFSLKNCLSTAVVIGL